MSADKRAALLQAGEELFSRNGYRDINVEEITRASGMSTGSFYHYFPSKEAFYEVIIGIVEQRGIREVDRLVSGLRSPLNRLKALYRFITLGIPRNPILAGILTGNRKYTFPGLRTRMESPDSLRSHIRETLTDILKEGVRKRVFRARLFNDPQAMLIAIFDAILMKLEATDVDNLMDDLLLLIERGLPRLVRLRKRDERLDRRLIRKKKSRQIPLP